MTGKLRDDRITVDVDDDVNRALEATEGRAWVCDSNGTQTAATRTHDGSVLVLRCEQKLYRSVRREVRIRPRGAVRQ